MAKTAINSFYAMTTGLRCVLNLSNIAEAECDNVGPIGLAGE